MKFILRILQVLAAAMILTACGPSSAPEAASIPLAGTYRLSELTDADGTVLSETLAKLDAEGSTVTLVLSEDGTGTVQLFDESEPVTWAETSVTFYGKTLSAERTAETLTLLPEDGTEGKMVFVPAEQ